MSSDSSDEENLDLLKEATDNNFFKNSFYRKGTEETAEEEKTVELPPSLRVKDEYDQFRLFDVTPQFQEHVGKLLSEKLEEYLRKEMVECHDKKKRKKKEIPNSIKLLKSSEHPIEVGNEEEENSENTIKQIRPKARSACISESDMKSIVITGEDILEKKGTQAWSNRSKAPISRYKKNEEGVLTFIEPEFK